MWRKHSKGVVRYPIEALALYGHVFFFFLVEWQALMASGISPDCRIENTGRKCVYALAASRRCVGLLNPGGLAPYRSCLAYTELIYPLFMGTF